MKFFPAVLTPFVLGCCFTVAHAQTAPPPADDGMLSRIGRWFTADRSTGWESAHWRVLASPATYHYSYNPEHRHVYSIGLERERADGFLIGGSPFRNSFGQPSFYLYAGQRFDKLGGVDQLFGQLTGGLLYGYKPPYDHKVPLNYKGFSPGAVASVGWQFTPTWSAQFNVLGNSALMLQLTADFR